MRDIFDKFKQSISHMAPRVEMSATVSEESFMSAMAPAEEVAEEPPPPVSDLRDAFIDMMMEETERSMRYQDKVANENEERLVETRVRRSGSSY